MSLQVNLRLSAMNVPTWLKHKSRPEEIEELPDYLSVEMSGTSTLSLVNIGNTAPTPDNSVYPWLKTDSGGNPLGWYICQNGVWTLAANLIHMASTAPGDTTQLWLKVDATTGAPQGFYKYVTGTSTWTPVPVGT